MITAVVLAAGRATRFGSDKLGAPLRGLPVVRHVIARLRDAGLTDIIVVTGGALGSQNATLDGDGVRVVENDHPELGLSSSLALGVNAIGPDAAAFLVALGDQPLIDPDVVRELIAIWNRSNAAAVVPSYRNGRGNPVLFDATMRRAVRALTGDHGARDLLDTLGDRVVYLAVDTTAPRDVDTPDDLRALHES